MLTEQLRTSALPLNAIRLALALSVIIAHSSPLSGICCGVSINPNLDLGLAAVGSFFALSGLLVTMSAMRQSGSSYLVARIRRIFPAYLLVLTATALVLAPIIHTLTTGGLGGFAWGGEQGPIAYLLGNASLSVNTHYYINDVFEGTTPFGGVNGSIWTLPIEFRAYLIALVVVLVGKRVGLTRSAVAALCITTSLILLGRFYPGLVRSVLPEFLPASYLPLVFVFLCGSVVATVAHRVTLTHTLGVAAIAVLIAALQMNDPLFVPIGLGTLAIVLPYLASLLPTRPFGWFTNDLSYGAYLWGFPVAQVLAFAGLNSLGLVPFALLSILCTLPFAAVSWFLVERHFIKRHAAAKGANRQELGQ
jgi:peptidoglycan/LPS O-acetylase OafA/YrhL